MLFSVKKTPGFLSGEESFQMGCPLSLVWAAPPLLIIIYPLEKSEESKIRERAAFCFRDGSRPSPLAFYAYGLSSTPLKFSCDQKFDDKIPPFPPELSLFPFFFTPFARFRRFNRPPSFLQKDPPPKAPPSFFCGQTATPVSPPGRNRHSEFMSVATPFI